MPIAVKIVLALLVIVHAIALAVWAVRSSRNYFAAVRDHLAAADDRNEP